MAKIPDVEPVAVGPVGRRAAEATQPKGRDKPPPFGTARPAGDGPVPRVVHPLDRAGPGLARFKIHATNYQDHCGIRYVLAKTEEDARACYRKDVRIDEVRARLKGKRADAPDELELVVVPLDD